MTARLCAALITSGMLLPSLLFPSHANASPLDDVTVQTAPVICSVLDEYPSVSGVEGVVLALHDKGFSGTDAGEIVGRAVIGWCPSHMPEVKAFVAKWSSAGTVGA